jgi:hypothetical protein
MHQRDIQASLKDYDQAVKLVNPKVVRITL